MARGGGIEGGGARGGALGVGGGQSLSLSVGLSLGPALGPSLGLSIGPNAGSLNPSIGARPSLGSFFDIGPSLALIGGAEKAGGMVSNSGRPSVEINSNSIAYGGGRRSSSLPVGFPGRPDGGSAARVVSRTSLMDDPEVAARKRRRLGLGLLGIPQ